MKKTKMILFVSACFLSTPSFAMDTDETKNVRVVCKKQAIPSIETATGWYSANNKIKIKYIQATGIGDFKGGALYGYIDPKFNEPQSQWQPALDKGFAKTAKGTNGVKFLNDNLLELKINGDERLYTTEVHKNNLGDYLAIFDSPAGHKQIKKLANNNKFKIYECYFLSQENNNALSVELIASNKTQKMQKKN